MKEPQLTLFPIEHAEQKQTIQESFEAFDELNPHVFDYLVRLAMQARRAGAQRIGIGSLFEKLRWDYMIQTGDFEFKLNNNFRSRYARKIMDEVPELRGMFEVRNLRSE